MAQIIGTRLAKIIEKVISILIPKKLVENLENNNQTDRDFFLV